MQDKLKIAILGTRGIPNTYGGFEQCAEYLSVGLVGRGHEVTVYNPHIHEFEDDNFKGVQIIRKYSPEEYIGAAANFVYDYLCLRDALKRDFDVILECGYGTASASYYLCPIERTVLITNMDGLEWKRAKWNKPVKRLMKMFEKWGAEKSHALVADNEEVQNHLYQAYGTPSAMIPYGATPFTSPDPAVLNRFNLQQNNFFLLIARLEPENNIEMILRGVAESGSAIPFLVIGNHETGHGEYLKNTFRQDNIHFLGSIYDRNVINNLRFYCRAYFHGHSVGGTNPSLLEAMACSAVIVAHNNEFNRSVLEKNAFYFSSPDDIKRHIQRMPAYEDKKKSLIERNHKLIDTKYNWRTVVDQYEALFKTMIEEGAVASHTIQQFNDSTEKEVRVFD